MLTVHHKEPSSDNHCNEWDGENNKVSHWVSFLFSELADGAYDHREDDDGSDDQENGLPGDSGGDEVHWVFLL